MVGCGEMLETPLPTLPASPQQFLSKLGAKPGAGENILSPKPPFWERPVSAAHSIACPPQPALHASSLRTLCAQAAAPPLMPMPTQMCFIPTYLHCI